jgi:hypothetical protein
MWPRNFFSNRRAVRPRIPARNPVETSIAVAADRQVVRAGQQRGAGHGFGADAHRRAHRGHGVGVLDRHRLVIPARGGDRPATPAHLRDPLVLGHLRRRRRLHIDNLAPLTPALLGPFQRGITAPTALRLDLQRVVGIIDEAAR